MVRPPTDPLLGVIPADPALRRIAVAGWAIIAVLGGVVLWYVTRTLDHARAMAVYDPRGAFMEVQRVVIPAVIVGVIAGVALSAYCLVTGMRILRAGRFPAPGARVLRATPIRRGAVAQRAGVAMMVIAVTMLALSVGLPFFLRRAMQAVESTDVRFRAVPPDTEAPPNAPGTAGARGG